LFFYCHSYSGYAQIVVDDQQQWKMMAVVLMSKLMIRCWKSPLQIVGVHCGAFAVGMADASRVFRAYSAVGNAPRSFAVFGDLLVLKIERKSSWNQIYAQINGIQENFNCLIIT
jgi:hypothetical protein